VSEGLGWIAKVIVPVRDLTRSSDIVAGVCGIDSPNRGEEETVVLLTGNGILNSEGDSVGEPDVKGEASELLSLNNNPLLPLRTNFALSSVMGRCSAGSFTAMVLMSVRIVSWMGTPNARRW